MIKLSFNLLVSALIKQIQPYNNISTHFIQKTIVAD